MPTISKPLVLEPITPTKITLGDTMNSTPCPPMNCSPGKGPSGTDSGYGSATSSSFNLDKSEDPQSRQSPSTAPSSPTPVISRGIPLPGTELLVFRKDVNDSFTTRYKDVFDRIKEPLLRLTKKLRKCQPIALRLVVLGKTEEDAKPTIVVFCPPTVHKKIRKFFAQPEIREIYDPKDKILLPLDVVIIACPPQLRTSPRTVEVSSGLEPGTLCGSLLRIKSGTSTRITTLGGLVKATESDGSYCLYGMIAGHAATDLKALDSISLDSSVDGVESDNLSSDGDLEEEEDEDEDEEEEVDDAPLSPLFVSQKGKLPADATIEPTRIWKSFGHIKAPTFASEGQSLDWGLVAIDHVKDCLPNKIIGVNPEQRGPGDLVIPSARPHKFKKRNVVMMSGVQGTKEGVLSMRSSHALFGPGQDFTATHLLSLEDSEIIDGDSGSWIANQATGEVYGHLIASDVLGDGYVIPLSETLQDMRVQLQVASVELPTSIDVVSFQTNWIEQTQSSHERPNSRDGLISSLIPSKSMAEEPKDSGYSTMQGSSGNSPDPPYDINRLSILFPSSEEDKRHSDEDEEYWKNVYAPDLEEYDQTSGLSLQPPQLPQPHVRPSIHAFLSPDSRYSAGFTSVETGFPRFEIGFSSVMELGPGSSIPSPLPHRHRHIDALSTSAPAIVPIQRMPSRPDNVRRDLASGESIDFEIAALEHEIDRCGIQSDSDFQWNPEHVDPFANYWNTQPRTADDVEDDIGERRGFDDIREGEGGEYTRSQPEWAKEDQD